MQKSTLARNRSETADNERVKKPLDSSQLIHQFIFKFSHFSVFYLALASYPKTSLLLFSNFNSWDNLHFSLTAGMRDKLQPRPSTSSCKKKERTQTDTPSDRSADQRPCWRPFLMLMPGTERETTVNSQSLIPQRLLAKILPEWKFFLNIIRGWRHIIDMKSRQIEDKRLFIAVVPIHFCQMYLPPKPCQMNSCT